MTSTDSHLKKYLSVQELQNLECLRSTPIRKSALKRSLLRKAYYLKNKKYHQEYSKKWYQKNKVSPIFKERQKKNWKSFEEKQKSLNANWVRDRSRKYQKPYSALSENLKNKMRLSQKSWQERHWKERVAYAKIWRSRQPRAGLRKAIILARKTGDIRTLTTHLKRAIALTYGKSNRTRNHTHNSERGL